MKYLFITGAGRSGTTLIEKILHNHPQIGLGSQPFPNLFINIKLKYLQQNNLSKRYAFDHLFRDNDYKLNAFNRFLNSCVLTNEEIEMLFHDLYTFSGQYMPGFLDYCHGRIVPGTFFDIYKQFLSYLTAYLGKENILYVGTKETWLEECIPYLLDKNVKSIIIIRDPRDIVTSLYYGKGTRYGGNRRPLLYILRQWRKSLSFCAQYQPHPNFAWFKYEDLVKETESVLKHLTSWLKITPYLDSSFSKGLFDQQGNLWLGNSSFGKYSDISKASVASFQAYLPEACVRYIESVCYPELLFLNYEFLCCKSGPDIEAIRSFTEPLDIDHRKFNPRYSQNASRIEQEIQRLSHFKTELNVNQQRTWFIFPRAYQMLKQAQGSSRQLSVSRRQ